MGQREHADAGVGVGVFFFPQFPIPPRAGAGARFPLAWCGVGAVRASCSALVHGSVGWVVGRTPPSTRSQRGDVVVDGGLFFLGVFLGGGGGSWLVFWADERCSFWVSQMQQIRTRRGLVVWLDGGWSLEHVKSTSLHVRTPRQGYLTKQAFRAAVIMGMDTRVPNRTRGRRCSRFVPSMHAKLNLQHSSQCRTSGSRMLPRRATPGRPHAFTSPASRLSCTSVVPPPLT